MIVTNTSMADLALTNLGYCSHANLHGFAIPGTKLYLASIVDSFVLSLTGWRSICFVMVPFLGFVLNWESEFDLRCKEIRNKIFGFDLRCKERERRLRLREELGIWSEEERTPVGRERETNCEERENQLKKWEEREKLNKKIIDANAIFVPTMAKLQRYCPMLQKFDTFNTSDKTPFLVFSVPNVPYYSI